MKFPSLLALLCVGTCMAAPGLSGNVTFERVTDPITDENRSYLLVPEQNAAAGATVMLRCRSGNVQAIIATPAQLIPTDPAARSARSVPVTVRFDRSPMRVLGDSDLLMLSTGMVDTHSVALRGAEAQFFIRSALKAHTLALRVRDQGGADQTYLFDLTGLKAGFNKIGACRAPR